MSQPIASSSSSAEDRDSPPPPPPNTPTSTPSYPRLPGVGGDASGTPGGSNWSTALAKRAVPYFDASKINPEIIPGIAGAVAGLVSGVVTCPLDVIKTKLQAQGAAWGKKREPRYRGLIGTTKVILQEEGVRGMYRGLGPLILGYLPTWTVYFFVYENMKKKMETR
jgi:solute carrier family 25 folate transporter 32